MFIRIVGPRTIPANLPQLWSERHTFLMSYWGFFGGVNVPLPDFVYTVLNGIAALAVVGLLIGLARSVRRWAGLDRSILFGRAVSVIWIVVLFVSLLRWTSATWASQGRLIFGAIAPLSLWLAVGLWQMPKGRGWFFIMAAFESPHQILYAYDDSDTTLNTFSGCRFSSDEPLSHISFREPNQSLASIELFQYQYEMLQQSDGQYVQIEGWFSTNERPGYSGVFHRDWSTLIHVENQDGVIIAQRDVYLKQGLWATTLKAQETWCNHFAVRIPDYAYRPQTLNIYLGFYDLKSPTQERMIAEGPGVTADNRFFLGTIQLLARESPLNVPNPMRVNFGGEAELVGYDVSNLVMFPNQKVTITLYWRALHPMTTDYRVFTQIVEPNTTRVFGNGDSMPAMWARLTSGWKPGEIIKDEHTFTTNADAPPGTWQIVAGMYQPTTDGGFRRLRVITPDGGEASDFVELSRVKMLPPPEEF
jgi:hypothetical protein